GSGGWRTVATAEAARSGPTTSTSEPVTTDPVRLVATSGYDPRNVHVAEIELDAGVDVGTNRGAHGDPILDSHATKRLSRELVQPAVPEAWSALYAPAPDGTGRLAVARWDGPDSTELRLATADGAPLLTRTATVDGDAT